MDCKSARWATGLKKLSAISQNGLLSYGRIYMYKRICRVNVSGFKNLARLDTLHSFRHLNPEQTHRIADNGTSHARKGDTKSPNCHIRLA